MIFKLFCKNLKNNKEEIVFYENLSNSFFDENFKKKIENNNKIINIKKITNSDFPKSLSISLGSKCNFHCDYCVQNGNKESVEFTTEKRKNFLFFIEKFYKNLINLETARLMGGETLVYWKNLVFIIKILRKKIKNLKKISITTNGSLLTKDKIDFFKKYDVCLRISYDGKESFRDFDILSRDDIVETLQYAHDNGIKMNFVVVPSHYSVFEISNQIKEKLGFEPLITKSEFEPLITKSEFEPLITKTLNSGKNDKENRIAMGKEKNILNIQKFYNNIKTLIKNSRGIIHGENRRYNCPNINDFVIDGDLNVIGCLHFKNIILGNLRNIEKFSEIEKKFISKLERKKCLNCCFINFCPGVCDLIDENTAEFDENCRKRSKIARGFFRYGLRNIFKLDLVDYLIYDL